MSGLGEELKVWQQLAKKCVLRVGIVPREEVGSGLTRSGSLAGQYYRRDHLKGQFG